MNTFYNNPPINILQVRCEAEAFINLSLLLPNLANNNTTVDNNGSSTSSTPNTTSGAEPFGDYFQRWLVDEERNLVDLRLATFQANDDETTTTTTSTTHKRVEKLVHRVMCHYEDYYKVKSESIEHDVVYMLSAPWLSPLEHTYQWIGGWRATTAFHLLYTVVGLQLEARLLSQDNLVIIKDDDLSSAQLVVVDELQRQTIRQERELSEALASLQEAVADSSMVQLSHLATTNLLLCDPDHHYNNDESVNEQVKSNLKAKEDKLKKVFWKADHLLVTMFKKAVEVLSPLQAAHFLIAAAELHLRLHDWVHHHNFITTTSFKFLRLN